MITMQEILGLSIKERIMIKKIWESIEDLNDIKIPETHEQELDKRLSRYEKGETKFVSWNHIKSELNVGKQ